MQKVGFPIGAIPLQNGGNVASATKGERRAQTKPSPIGEGGPLAVDEDN